MGTHNRILNGPCKITITDKETGETIMLAEGFMQHYSMSTNSQLAEYISGHGVVDHIAMNRTLSLTAIITSFGEDIRQKEIVGYLDRATGAQPKPEYFSKKSCAHEWKTYEGFMDTYDYCKKCNEKRT